MRKPHPTRVQYPPIDSQAVRPTPAPVLQDFALALFGKKKKDDSAGGGNDPGDSAAGVSGFTRDERKARKFFDHAEGAVEKNSLDFAIEMYVSGLRFDPDNMIRHEQLFAVAQRRKAANGKKAGSKDKKSLGPSVVDKMLLAEKIWAYDFTDQNNAIDFFSRVVAAEAAEPDLNLAEVADWIGTMALEIPVAKPRLRNWTKIRDLFEQLGFYDKAVEACRKAMHMDMNSDALQQSMKDLEAQAYSSKSTSTEKGGFRDNIKDKEFAAEAASGSTRATSKVDQAIAARREEYEEDPEDLDRVKKLVDALLKKEGFEEDEQAMKLLARAHEDSGQYIFKVRIGDIRMKQFTRELRQLKQFVEAAPEDDSYRDRYKDTLKEKLAFELNEYDDRVKNYPTDLRLKFELGRRQYAAKQFDDAIGSLQQASEDPKSRNSAKMYLARCFMEKQWFDEAVETITAAAEAYGIPDDKVGKELNYDKLKAQLAAAESNGDLDLAEEAGKTASEILRADIGYKDIRDLKTQAVELIKKLKG